MSNFIYNEIPSWSVNWTNKVFTVINDIDKIEEVFIWGAAYRSLSFSWNTITLVDAPPIGTSISVDYFIAGITPTPSSSTVTFLEVINDVYEKLWQNPDNKAINKTYKLNQVKLWINAWLKRLKNMRTYIDEVGEYSFNKTKELTAIWYNASYVEIWEAISYIPSSGVYLLGNSKITSYSSYNLWRLNGTTGVTYKNGDIVRIGYKVPTGVKKISEVIVNGVVVKYSDWREYTTSSNKYSLYKDASWTYLFLPYCNDNVVVTVKYVFERDLLVADADIVNIEWEYFEVLSYYTLWKIYEDREDDRADRAKRQYELLLRERKAYKSKAVDEIKGRIWSSVLTNF